MKILNINNFDISKIFLLPPYKNEDHLISNINYDNEDYKETINKIKQAQNDLNLLEKEWVDLEEKNFGN